MHRHILKTLLFFLFFSARTAFASPGDSATAKVPTILHYTNTESDIMGTLHFFSLDTTLNGIEVFNPAIEYFYNDLGNIGSASDPKIFFIPQNLLTAFGNHTFDLYQWKPSGVRYYKTNKRYSSIDYHLSGGKEQQITFTLDQNILSNLNAGFDFNRQGSLGFLNNGKTSTTNFDFFTWYHSPNGRYQAFASVIWNSIKNEVNGGLKSDSLYNANSYSNNDLAGLQISLVDAEQHVRSHEFSLKHYYDLVTRKDSSGTNFPFLRLTHFSDYERSSYNYNDNNSDSAFYEHNYFSSSLKDSFRYDQWVNKISLQAFCNFKNFKPVSRAAVEVSGGYQWFNLYQLYDTTLSNYFAEAHLKTAGIRNRSALDVSGRYILNGANEKDYLFRLTFRFPLPWGAAMHIGLQDASQRPELSRNFYLSDHFIWENRFDKITSQQYFIGIDFDQYHFTISGTSMVVGRYIYFDTLAEPVQSLDSIRLNQLFISKDFTLGKFHLNNFVWIQETNSDEVRVPEFLSYHSLFYENKLFKKKLGMQIGFDVHYTSGYFSNAYSPAASVFYTQNSVKTNDYPLMDFFVNLKIKTARIFIKFQNAGDNIIRANYFNTPAYPMPGLVFQFGLNWRFFDE
jgi:hypothetical protein